MARSSIGRASAFEAEGCEFEPRRAIQSKSERVPQTVDLFIIVRKISIHSRKPIQN